MRLVVLGIGTAALLYAMLDMAMDLRGANDFVRPFHHAGILVTVIVSTFLFWALLKILPATIRQVPVVKAAAYLALLLTFWHFALPLGDSIAEQRERATRSSSEVGDTGYGWFYWDDSGMGSRPMSMIGVLIIGAVRIPFASILLITFIYLILRLPLAIRSEQVAEPDL